MKARKTNAHSGHSHDEEIDAEGVYAALKERGYRITAPRRALIEALLSAKEPKNAKDLAKHTGIKDPSTIYRTLAELVKEGLTSELADAGVVYYEMHEQHHDHAICDACGTIEHIPCGVTKAPKALVATGFKAHDHEIIWRGLCVKCV